MAANAGTWENLVRAFVDAAFEVLGCQGEVYLVVNWPIRGIPGCCPRQLVGVESVGEGEFVALCELSESPSSVVLSVQCQIFLLSLPSVGMRQGLLWHSNRLELQVYPWESLL